MDTIDLVGGGTATTGDGDGTTATTLLPPSSQPSYVEIYENERKWIGGGGFSAKGLLPNDRGPYSSVDGSVSWKTLDDASAALLLPGQAYREHSSFAPASVADISDNNNNNNHNHPSDRTDRVEEELISDEALNTVTHPDHDDDDDGWRYARDFSANALAHAQRRPNRLLHWVRFRKWVRPYRIGGDVASLFPHYADARTLQDLVAKCDYGDSLVAAQLDDTLVQVLAYLTLLSHPKPSSPVTLATLLDCKRKILHVISQATTKLGRQSSLSSPRSSTPATASPADDGNDSTATTQSLPRVRLTAWQRALYRLADEERNKAQHLLSSVEVFANRHHDAAFGDRCRQIRQSDRALSRRPHTTHGQLSYFPERHNLVAWILRLLDNDGTYMFHCAQPHCGTNCPFFHVSCPHPGCAVTRLSRNHLAAHVEACEFATVTCPDCGASLVRRDMAVHTQETCPQRAVPCPFGALGCATECSAHDLPVHMTQQVASHLQLTLARLVEVQDVVRDVRRQVTALQAENQQLRQALDKARADTAQAVQRQGQQCTQQLQRQERAHRKEITRLDHALTKITRASSK